jgi:poly-gamma-glutamate capsule biosynthesis protein CapA/YwtB (metallophosphatase superfamily)
MHSSNCALERRNSNLKWALVIPIIVLCIGITFFVILKINDFYADTPSKEAMKHKKRIAPSDLNKDLSEEWTNKPITLLFAGDTLFDWSVKETVRTKGADFPFVHVKKEVQGADYAVLNLETAVTTLTDKDPNQLYNFKSDPEALSGIKNTGFDLVSLGNNHALDFRVAGLLETIENLNQYELPYIGAGKDEKEAYASETVVLKGKSIKFLAFSRFMPSTAWFAGKNQPGIASAYQEDKVLAAIEKEKPDADFLFVYIHWGVEKNTIPEEWQRRLARDMIDTGADGVIGSHPHVLQGVEYYDNKPIAYSLGNFLFPDYVRGKSAETGLLKLHIQDGETAIEFKPYYIRNDKIIRLSEQEQERILEYMEGISFDVIREDYRFYAAK